MSGPFKMKGFPTQAGVSPMKNGKSTQKKGTSQKIGPVESPESIQKAREKVETTKKAAKGKSGTVWDASKESRKAASDAQKAHTEMVSYSKD
jgi:hypothetical protein